MTFLFVHQNRRHSICKGLSSILSSCRVFNPPLESSANRMQGLLLLCLMLCLIFSGCTGKQETPPIDLREIFSSTVDVAKAKSADMNRLVNIGKKIGEESPFWPVYMYLMGEIHRLRGETREAETRFEKIVTWAASDSSKDKSGTSGLAGVALWRLLQLRNTDQPLDAKDASRIIGMADKILKTRLVQGMFRLPVLEALPMLEEDIKLQLALVAARSNMPKEAQRFFLDYLAVSRTVSLSEPEKMLSQKLMDAGMVSRDHIALLRGRRLYELRRYPDASKFLEEARKSENLQIRAEAIFYLAMMKQSKAELGKKIAMLAEVVNAASDPHLAQNALYYLGRALRAKEDKEKSVQAFERILSDFPLGNRADDALYEMAQEYNYSGDTEQSLLYYERLRNFKGQNDFASYSGMDPAMILYARNGEKDREAAYALLQDLERRVPEGPFHLNALFWMGRIAADRGNQRQAQEYFKKIIERSPFDYYALRARMHLHMGNKASQSLLPDEETRKEVQNVYKESKHDGHLSGGSPYHRRLSAALSTGLYQAAFGAYQRLRERFPSTRLEDLTFADLNESGLFPQVAVLLALRQDAFAAADTLEGEGGIAINFLQVSDNVSKAGDWPLSMSIIIQGRDIPEKSVSEQRAAMERVKFYLATAYPSCFRQEILAAASNKAGGSYQVSPEMLYSIVRRESLFCSTALSKAGALGLFQFMPGTFNSLNTKWKLLRDSGAPSRETFLLNPKQSISLGARWFNEELLPRHDGNVLFAVMDHNVGPGNVRQWKQYWKDLDKLDDVEYVVETIRARETRTFTRKTLGDLMVADAIGLLRQ